MKRKSRNKRLFTTKIFVLKYCFIVPLENSRNVLIVSRRSTMRLHLYVSPQDGEFSEACKAQNVNRNDFYSISWSYNWHSFDDHLWNLTSRSASRTSSPLGAINFYMILYLRQTLITCVTSGNEKHGCPENTTLLSPSFVYISEDM